MKYDNHVNITSLCLEFSENYQWLKSAARLKEGNRFAEVKSHLEYIAQHYNAKTNQVRKDFEERQIFLTSLEAKRFNEAVDYLRTMNRNHLPIGKIRSMCKGPYYHLNEIPAIGNSEGRDIQFEFALGAFLKKAGFPIHDFDDIQMEYASSLIRYECKRPALRKNVPTRFNDAVSQLERKIAQQDNEYGIVALSIEKIDNFDKKLFRGDDISGVFDILIQIKDAVFEDLQHSIKVPSDKKIIGLHLFVSTFLWNKATGTFVDVSAHFTKRTIQNTEMPLYDYLFNTVRERLEAV
jgi:hypothetical protein